MKHSIPNIIRRGATFHFKKRVPLAIRHTPEFINKEFIQFSLGTSDRRQAIKLLSGALEQFDRLIERSSKASLVKQTEVSAHETVEGALDKMVIAEAIDQYFSSRRNQYTPKFDIELDKAIPHKDDKLIFGVLETCWRNRLAELDGDIDLDERTDDVAANLIERRSWHRLLDDSSLAEYLMTELRSSERAFILDILNCATEARSWKASDIDKWVQKPLIDNVTLDAVVAAYKKNNSGSTEHYNKMLVAKRAWIELIGKRQIKHIEKVDVTKFIELLRQVPKNYARSNRSMLNQISDCAFEENAKLKPKTIKANYIGPLSTALTEAVAKGLIGTNPFLQVKVKGSTQRAASKRGFTVTELNRLLQQPVFCGSLSKLSRYKPGSFIAKDKYYWSPLIAMFTGLRAAEIANLRTADLETIDTRDDVLYILKVSGSKTENAERIVPVHPTLIQLGFIKFIKQQKMLNLDYVFNDWTRREHRRNSSDRAIRNFNERISPEIVISGSAPSFHCFRHTLKVEMIGNGLSMPINNAILGHAQVGMDRHYFRADQVSTAINIADPFFAAVKFEGLEIDHLF